MPDPYDRHGRSRDMGWSSQLPRSQQRTAAAREPAKRPPARKDPSLCKGTHWKGPHAPEVQLPKGGHPFGKGCHWYIAGWTTDRHPAWSCHHRWICPGCGKDTGSVLQGDCPDFREITPEEKDALDEQLRNYDEHLSMWRWGRKPPINGPQGYRKKKDATPGDS